MLSHSGTRAKSSRKGLLRRKEHSLKDWESWLIGKVSTGL